MKIGFFETEDGEINVYKKQFVNEELTFDTEPLDEKNLEKAINLDVLSTRSHSKLTSGILEKIPTLKMIATRTTGFDHIDLQYCKEKNITVSNVPEYGSFTVAEHTIGLMLAVSRNLIPSVERTRRGNFSSAGLKGFELHGKTLGVIGVGSIGKAVIKIAKAFGMNIIALTKSRDPEVARELGFTYAELDELLSQSDVITLHLPYSKDTHHMINKENIRKFKKGSVLINTARGGIVDTEAVLLGIDEKILRGAGLDVIEDEEKLSSNEYYNVLLTRENVIITPHNAFNSKESRDRILNITVKNIIAFVEEKPQNIIIVRA